MQLTAQTEERDFLLCRPLCVVELVDNRQILSMSMQAELVADF